MNCKYEKLGKYKFDYATNSWLPTGEYMKGDLLEYNSDCTPTEWLFKLSNTENANEHIEPCTSDGIITERITINLTKSDYNRLEIGYCCREIGDFSFNDWALLQGDLIIPDSVETIGLYGFGGCHGFKGTLTLPTGITAVGDSAFHTCSGFTGNLIIPDKVTTIGASAFISCSGFDTITISSSITTIFVSAFAGCSNLKAIYCKATTPPTLSFYDSEDDEGTIFRNTNDCPIYVPCNSVDAYKSAISWRQYVNRIKGWDFEKNKEC